MTLIASLFWHSTGRFGDSPVYKFQPEVACCIHIASCTAITKKPNTTPVRGNYFTIPWLVVDVQKGSQELQYNYCTAAFEQWLKRPGLRGCWDELSLQQQQNSQHRSAGRNLRRWSHLHTMKIIDLRVADKNGIILLRNQYTSFVCGYAHYTLINLLVVETSKG